MRQLARLTLSGPIPPAIMKFRHLLEKHQLAVGVLQVINGYLQDKALLLRQGSIVDATIIQAPSSTTRCMRCMPMPVTQGSRSEKSMRGVR